MSTQRSKIRSFATEAKRQGFTVEHSGGHLNFTRDNKTVVVSTGNRGNDRYAAANAEADLLKAGLILGKQHVPVSPDLGAEGRLLETLSHSRSSTSRTLADECNLPISKVTAVLKAATHRFPNLRREQGIWKWEAEEEVFGPIQEIARAGQEFVYPLRPGVQAKLWLPEGLTPHEIKQLVSWIKRIKTGGS
jgi:hypothetical protein